MLRLSLNIVGEDKTNFPHKLLLTDRHVENIRKIFAKKLSTGITLPKTNCLRWYKQDDFLVDVLVRY